MLEIYNEKKVFITGGSGFKGSWMCNWLNLLGAEVVNYSLVPYHGHNHYDISGIEHKVYNEYNDIRNIFGLEKAIEKAQPELVIHLAAQPLVRDSYKDPIKTFNTNVCGTINLLEVCRKVESIKAIIVITTDKVYEDIEDSESRSESDRLGGYDPYSSSKVCAEVISDCYKKSFFKDNKLLATVRAGNVIGGGDWGIDRIVPDIVKSIYEQKQLKIRNLNNIRPWSYILDILYGYLLLGEKLLQDKKGFEGSWNFSSDEKNFISVEKIINKFEEQYNLEYEVSESELKETKILKLDSSKAKKFLKWKPIYSIDKILYNTINWYKEYYEKGNCITKEQIMRYMDEI